MEEGGTSSKSHKTMLGKGRQTYYANPAQLRKAPWRKGLKGGRFPEKKTPEKEGALSQIRHSAQGSRGEPKGKNRRAGNSSTEKKGPAYEYINCWKGSAQGKPAEALKESKAPKSPGITRSLQAPWGVDPPSWGMVKAEHEGGEERGMEGRGEGVLLTMRKEKNRLSS